VRQKHVDPIALLCSRRAQPLPDLRALIRLRQLAITASTDIPGPLYKKLQFGFVVAFFF
jgi:hypothetical protein